MSRTLGIDLGTQAVKAVIYCSDEARVISSGSAPLTVERDAEGRAEQHASDWLQAVERAVAGLDANARRSVSAIGVSGQQHGFVALDAAGDVLIPVKLWCDTSTEVECGDLMARFGGPDRCIERLGNPILPGYTASKVLWFRRTWPERYRNLATILLPHDYLNFHLTGERCMEFGDASGTGFLDVRKREWSGEMLRCVDSDRDLRECLPGPRADNEPVGQLREAVAADLGLPAGIPVSIGGGDNMMGAIGTGNVRPGRVTVSLGTSGTVYACSDRPIVDERGEIAAFCSSTGGWLPLLCTMNCTVSTELVRELFGADLDAFEGAIAAAPAASQGVITLPFFNGERTPNLPSAKGCVVGLDTGNARPENLMRSAVEGATFALCAGLDSLRALGIDADRIVLTGGGSRSGTWRQIVADICALPVTVLEQDEGAALGAALQALALLGSSPTDLAPLVDEHLRPDPARSCEPGPDADVYGIAYRSYRDAVAAATTLYRQAKRTSNNDRTQRP